MSPEPISEDHTDTIYSQMKIFISADQDYTRVLRVQVKSPSGTFRTRGFKVKNILCSIAIGKALYKQEDRSQDKLDGTSQPQIPRTEVVIFHRILQQGGQILVKTKISLITIRD